METMVAAKETIATVLGRLAIPDVGHDVMVFVVATPSSQELQNLPLPVAQRASPSTERRKLEHGNVAV